ncbi:cobalamin biosynthesis protein [Actinoplanes sp. DH11]|uniref:cobalamin biosynthesis protein n=1 Tax=Actinoplanes sp. DH11 TaxID=2857011 RepID=UPI001E449B32|nr:cobalamin biosynthesis protein [Actinoplanes sp. DH11]
MIVVGLGARAGTPADVLAEAVRAALAEAGVAPGDVAVLATLDRRAQEAGVRDLAGAAGWRLRGFPAADLAAVAVPSPSARVAAAVGTAGVAEAAALLAAGPGGAMLLPKRRIGPVTVAIAG